MADLGWFADQRVELMGGEVVVMPIQKFPHSAALDRTRELLTNVLGAGVWVRAQAPLALGRDSEPEPDVSVVTGKRTDYSDHPTTAVLVVEVSDTTLRYDRARKASLYASAGIADYWIVNLVDRQLEVRRDPVADQGYAFGFRYGSVTTFSLTDRVSPLAYPKVQVAVADLFP